jgi:hypothetical protein
MFNEMPCRILQMSEYEKGKYFKEKSNEIEI